MTKKRNTPAFDESFLIGSISGLNKNKEPDLQLETKDNPITSEPDLQIGETPKPITPGPVLQMETKDTSSDMENVSAAPEAPDLKENEESKGKNKSVSNSPASPKPKPGKGWEYERFLTPTTGRKTAHGYISDTKHNKIRQILALANSKSGITDYLDNVLEEHFERNDAQIKELFKKYLGDGS